MGDQPSTVISINLPKLNHAEACKVAKSVLESPRSTNVIIDLSGTNDITTAAFAKFVLLQKQLSAIECNLILSGLSGRVAAMYRVCKLERILPVST